MRAGTPLQPLDLPPPRFCLAHLGRLDEAREIVARLRSLTPLVIPNGTLYRKPEHQELFISGLRLAAGET